MDDCSGDSEWLILSVSPALLRHGGPLCSVACLSEPDCAVDDHDFQRLRIDDRRFSAVAALLVQMSARDIFIYESERFAAVGAFGLALDLHPIELVRRNPSYACVSCQFCALLLQHSIWSSSRLASCLAAWTRKVQRAFQFQEKKFTFVPKNY